MHQKFLDLTKHHIAHCGEYAKMMNAVHFDAKRVKSCLDIPFLPVSLFKELELRSIPADEIFKTMTSSGTTGQAVSKIYLDKDTANSQQRALVKIVSDSIGASRMPMLIIDCPSVLRDRAKFSARGAGILGFSIFGADKTYALDDDMKLDLTAVETFLAKHSGKRILLFGFTFMIWQHFYKELCRLNKSLDLRDAVLIHGGGWKKLISEAVSKAEFRDRLKDVCGLRDIHDYYGMVEQTGSIFMECEYGHLHTNEFNDIFVRRAVDFSPCDFGERGIIQVMSVLPESYPGHSLLTEDEGIIIGEDDCPCKKPGKYFEVIGRLKNAEIRGCSDTYAERFN
jgi:phenylacetate-coenzyme A ligase PaaK-like adenylate-forming protein